MSTFAQSYGHDGKKMDVLFKYQTIGLNIDECMNLFKLL